MEPDEQATIYTYNNIINYIGKTYLFHDCTKETKSKEEYNDFNKIIQITNENDTSELIIDAKCYSNDITNLKKAYICDDDICLFQGYTHALQCLSGSCTFKNDATNTIRDIPFDNFPAGLCRYNAKANSIECDDVYVKLTLFQKGCSYMHCGKLKRGSCVIDDECTYNICTNEKRVSFSDGPSDCNNLIILVYIYLSISILVHCDSVSILLLLLYPPTSES